MALVAAAACLLLAASASAVTRSQSRTASLDRDVFAQLNQIRAAHGLHTLALSPSLSAAALEHTREMVADGYFAHRSADGTPFWKRIRDYYPDGAFGYWSVGENLFWTTGPSTASAGLDAWMASPPHRANILDPTWQQVGVASVDSTDAPGVFGRVAVTVITTDFGVRR
jgi:uncharacterized protein YkwD